MSRGGDYERLPMYAASTSSQRRRSSSSSPTLLPDTPRSIRPQGTTNSKSSNRFLLRPRHIYAFIKVALPVMFFLLLMGFLLLRAQVTRSWLHHPSHRVYDRLVSKHIDPIEPLAGCFDASSVSSSYNVSEYVYGPKLTECKRGCHMRMGMDCYNFAGTIKSTPPLSGKPLAPRSAHTVPHILAKRSSAFRPTAGMDAQILFRDAGHGNVAADAVVEWRLGARTTTSCKRI